MHDSMLAMWGQVTTRVIDVATGATIKVDVGPNAISYMAPLVVMDLLAQTDFDAIPLAVGGSHPLDASRGFPATETVLTTPTTNALRYMQVGTDATPSQRGDLSPTLTAVPGTES